MNDPSLSKVENTLAVTRFKLACESRSNGVKIGRKVSHYTLTHSTTVISTLWKGKRGREKKNKKKA